MATGINMNGAFFRLFSLLPLCDINENELFTQQKNFSLLWILTFKACRQADQFVVINIHSLASLRLLESPLNLHKHSQPNVQRQRQQASTFNPW